MAPDAVSLAGIHGRYRGPTPLVFVGRDWFQMSRVDALAIATQVVELMAFLNRPAHEIPRHAMDEQLAFTNRRSPLAVPVSLDPTSPLPAAICGCLIDMSPEASFLTGSKRAYIRGYHLSGPCDSDVQSSSWVGRR